MPTGIYPRRYVTLAQYLDVRSARDGSGCILWTGQRTFAGYGLCNWKDGRGLHLKTTAHRAAFISGKGPIPQGLEIDHLCRNTRCVNPDHLEAVTRLENVRRGLKATQTHCIHGHEFTPENTMYKKVNGCRVCRACANERQRQLRAEQRRAI